MRIIAKFKEFKAFGLFKVITPLFPEVSKMTSFSELINLWKEKISKIKIWQNVIDKIGTHTNIHKLTDRDEAIKKIYSISHVSVWLLFFAAENLFLYQQK